MILLPIRMHHLDPRQVGASLRTIEDYIYYISERANLLLSDLERTTAKNQAVITALEARIAALEEQQNEGGNN